MISKQFGAVAADSIGTGALTASEIVTISSVSPSVSSFTGALRVMGGVGIIGDVHVGGTIYGSVSGGAGGGTDYSQTFRYTNTIDSTSSSSGALVTTGGLGVYKSVNAGKSINAPILRATSTDSGALIVDGGASLSGDLRVGGTIYGALDQSSLDFTREFHSENTTDATGVGTGAISTVGGISASKSLHIGGDLRVGGTITGHIDQASIDLNDPFHFTNTEDLAIIIDGGASLAKDFNVGGGIKSYSVNAGAATFGSLKVDGGASVAGDIYANNVYGNPFIITTNLVVSMCGSTTSSIIGDFTFRLAKCGKMRSLIFPSTSFMVSSATNKIVSNENVLPDDFPDTTPRSGVIAAFSDSIPMTAIISVNNSGARDIQIYLPTSVNNGGVISFKSTTFTWFM